MKKMSDEARLKMRLAKLGKPSVNRGRVHTPQARLNMSRGRIGMKLSAEHVRNIAESNRGKTLTDEQKNNVRIGVLRSYKYDEVARKNHLEGRKKFIVPYQDTSIEVKVQNALTARNIKFTKHKTVCQTPANGYHRCDIFIDPNIVIECDGNYWHNYPHGTQKDKILNQMMKANGYKVLRFWESEINDNFKNVVDLIEAEVYENIK